MLQDIHSHTYYSYCGKDSPEAVIKNAIESGLELVGISDHYYGIVMNRPQFVYEDEETKINVHQNALKRYYEHIKSLAWKYRNDIEVWCGVEITAQDLGYTLMPDGVDVSCFDYCLIENLQMEGAAVENMFEFAARCNCKRNGIAHMDLLAYIAAKGMDTAAFLEKMAKQNIFWELNVNYDSIHGYREHQYVKDFFADKNISDAIKNSGLTLSIGFDGHRLEDYDAKRVKSACRKLEEMGIPIIK